MIKRLVSIMAVGVSAMLAVHAGPADLTTWNFKQEMLPALVDFVPVLLKLQDQKTGRFGSELWIPPEQIPIYALAAAWSINDPSNRYYHDVKLLNAIMSGGDRLVEAQSKDGQWMFRKKDNSTWGMHYDPWVYSRWVRTFGLIRDAMPPPRRARWEKALTLGFSGIARSGLSRVHNIPSHHAMGLYIAGQALNHPEWCVKASEFLWRVAAAQDPNGFWSENYGPVVSYNFVYVDALGIYYSLTHDAKVLPALERAAQFHANFVYPDGSNIETIDERNPYSTAGHLVGPGFSFSPQGRAYLREYWNRTKNNTAPSHADFLATMLLYGQEGTICPLPAQNGDSLFVTADGKASVIRKGPWCAAFSAYVCPVDNSRWIQDRQNFVSLFHEKTGLILGGGNTKLQPLWSTFTVGNTKLLKHKPGDKNPNFAEPVGLLHVPSTATLDARKSFLKLQYGATDCAIRVSLSESNKARLTCTATSSSNNLPVAAHITFLPAIQKEWHTASGKSGHLKKAFDLTAKQAGGWFEHNGWRVQLPESSRITWPAERHNPYRDDGRSDPGDGRIVLTLTFSEKTTARSVDLEIVP